MNRSLRSLLVKASLFTTLLFAACDDSSSADDAEDSSSSAAPASSGSQTGSSDSQSSSSVSAFAYVLDTAAVDYKSTTAHMAAFLDFSAGSITHIAYDAWDIAIDASDATIIANCGIWGSGVRILKTASTDITADFTAEQASITGIVDTTVNPFAGEFSSQGAGSGTVYLIKDATGAYYKVAFASFGPMGKYSVLVAKGLAATTATEVAGSIVSAYGYTYIDLGDAKDVTTIMPKADAWDVKFARGLEFDMGGSFSARSAVTFNSKKGVKAAIAEGKNIAEVTTVDGVTFSSDPLLIGASWYTFDHTAKTYSVNTATYAFQTVEGNYAKLQLKSFYGPNQEQFWTIVKYGYQANGSQTFPE